jgi:hypothetical protein
LVFCVWSDDFDNFLNISDADFRPGPLSLPSIAFSPSDSWEGETEDCVATANGEDCLSCTLCANESASADCTNLEYGRKVECPLDGLAVPFFPFLSTFEYKADSNATLPATAGEAPTTAGAAPSVGSASAAAYLQKGWLATVGTVMMLAVGSVVVSFELS